MKRLRGFGSLVVIVVIAGAALIYTVAAGNKPLLGLDLQGGVSVVLKPVQEVDNETIDQAIAIIRQRMATGQPIDIDFLIAQANIVFPGAAAFLATTIVTKYSYFMAINAFQIS